MVLALHGVLLLVLLPRHEPCVDEARAWLIARDILLTELFTSFLRYEPRPGDLRTGPPSDWTFAE